MENFYIRSTKFSIQERQTKKHGKVYDGIFRVITMDGKEIQKRLSGFPSKSALKEAHSEFITKRCQLVKNIDVKNDAPRSALTFGDLYAQYIISQNNQIKDSTLHDKDKFYRLYIAPTFANLRMDEITVQLLYDWQDKLWSAQNPRTGEYYSYNYLAHTRMYLSAFLTWVEDRYEIPNLLKKVKKPKRRHAKTPMKFWTREQFEQFIQCADNPTYKMYFTMLFLTGRRKNEVTALYKKDVRKDCICFDKTYNRRTTDGSAYQITSTKNEKHSTTPICKPLQAALATYNGEEPFFFGGDVPLSESTVFNAFKRYTRRAGLPEIRVHDLRHSFVSMCIHLGASVYVVADLIGDTVEQVLKTYGHLYEEDKQKIIDKIQ